MRFASAGEAPAVEIAIASGPVLTIAGRMKLQSGGPSTVLPAIAGSSQHSQRGLRVGCDQGDVAAAGEHSLDLLEPHRSAPHHQAAAAEELQAGDVEGGVEHALHAALIADP